MEIEKQSINDTLSIKLLLCATVAYQSKVCVRKDQYWALSIFPPMEYKKKIGPLSI